MTEKKKHLKNVDVLRRRRVVVIVVVAAAADVVVDVLRRQKQYHRLFVCSFDQTWL